MCRVTLDGSYVVDTDRQYYCRYLLYQMLPINSYNIFRNLDLRIYRHPGISHQVVENSTAFPKNNCIAFPRGVGVVCVGWGPVSGVEKVLLLNIGCGLLESVANSPNILSGLNTWVLNILKQV